MADMHSLCSIFTWQRSLLYILLFLGTDLFGQTKELSIPKYKNGELTFWYKWESERIEKMKLQDSKPTSDSIYFRLSTDNLVLDIHSKDMAERWMIEFYILVCRHTIGLDVSNNTI